MRAEDIIIKQLEGGCFDVHVGNKSTGHVTYDEMLGTVAQLTMPENKRCLQWLQTEEQHQAFRNRYKPAEDVIQTQDIEYSNGIIRAKFTKALPVHKKEGGTNETM